MDLDRPPAPASRRALQVVAGGKDRFSEVSVVGLQHSFVGNTAIADLSLAVGGGQFVTLLGPSGSGKTTLLRIIAGLLVPTAGKVLIDQRDVSSVPPQGRDIGFVFQSYALFPHLTVEQNIAFPLRMRRDNASSQRQRVAEMLELVSLRGLEKRFPGQLSGGQQQRVALARALAHKPKLLLLDEPLGALDRRLRQQLGTDLRRIQREAAVTAIYVTHDQEEAFVLSDRIVVMHEGKVRQDGTPSEIYNRPQDAFVANFVGETNLLPGLVTDVHEDSVVVNIRGHAIECSHASTIDVGQRVVCVLRPEQIIVGPGAGFPPDSSARVIGVARVVDRIFLGSRHRVILDLDGQRLIADIDTGRTPPDVGGTVITGCAPLAPAVVTVEP